MYQPRLRAHFSCEIVDSETAFLVSERRHHLVEGAAAVGALPYLDGRHTVGDIVEALAPGPSVGQVVGALRRLAALGHLAEGSAELAPERAAWWDAVGVDPDSGERATRDGPVDVVGFGAVDVGPVVDALAAAGLPARDTGTAYTVADGPGFTVAVVDDYLHADLAELNRSAIDHARPWALVKPDGVIPWIGPVYTPDTSGCWRCLAQRLEGNRQVERFLERARDGEPPLAPGGAVVPGGPRTAAGLMAAQVALARAGGSAPTAGAEPVMITLDLTAGETARHVLVRQPQCSACGDPSVFTERDPRVTLDADRARHKSDGGYRVHAPAETLQRLDKHISPLLGAISHLENVGSGDNGITYSYSSGHNFAMVGRSTTQLRRNLRGQSGGKGRTDVQARTSAVCEAIERYSGLWRGDEPVVRASYDALDPATAVHVEELLDHSDEQYAEREAWNAVQDGPLHLVPNRFDTTVPYDWTTAWSITEERPRLVPSGYVWYGHPDTQAFFCKIDSNGNAAGNTVGEAVLQGFNEIVERDSVAIWWYNRLRRPALDLDSLNDPYVDTLREFYDTMDRGLWLLDLTSDLGIPAFGAVSHRRDHPVQDVLVGFGAHLDPRMAALRALTEVNQFLPAVEQRDERGDTRYLFDDPGAVDWWRTATLESDPWLRPDPDVVPRKITDFDVAPSDDIADDVLACVERARDRGLEVMVVDQSRPELELAVVKVIVPGMRHFWRRLGPGRLFDVPVRMGWQDAPTAVEDLNPKSVFF